MRIAVLDDYQAVAESLADWGSLAGCQVDFLHAPLGSPGAIVERLRGYEALVLMRERTRFPAEVLRGLPALRLIVTTGMNNRAIDYDQARSQGIVICGTPWAADTTVELTWGLILALARRIPQEDASLRAGRWQSGLGVTLRGKTLGVIGLGTIGTAVAQVGKALGMQALAWSPNLTPERARAADVRLAGKHELLEQADVVTMHLILGETTRGILAAADLRRMKPTALLVNTARGPLIDEHDLADALHRGVLAGAAVDVFSAEPIAADHPLLGAPNTLLTPHIGYVTREVLAGWYADAVEDIAGFLRGMPVRVLNA